MLRPCEPGLLLSVLASELHVSIEELRGPSRVRAISNARAIIHWTMRRVGFTLHDIGDILHKDHSSVAHAQRKVEAKRETSVGWKMVSDSCLALAKRIIEESDQ